MANNNTTSKYLSDVSSFGKTAFSVASNSPIQYKDRRHQFLADRRRDFVARRSHLASDYFTAEAQGLTKDFYEWSTVNVRLADITEETVSATRKIDDFKHVLFPDLGIEYFPIGAKLKAAGSTWLCINPSNISTVNATAILARCNASYNSYDAYGNIITEPLYVDNIQMYANNDNVPENVVLPEGNFRVTCQINENTRRLSHNKRIILGTQAYHITGFNDFFQEFTGDRESAHLMTFTVRLEEATDADDVSVNFVANGNNFDFSASVNARTEYVQNEEPSPISATFLFNGKPVDAEDVPYSFSFASSDESIAKVEETNGSYYVVPLSTGYATITASLRENPNIMATVDISVGNQPYVESIRFDEPYETEIRQYTTKSYTARCYGADGKPKPSEAITWHFSGASYAEDYKVEISEDGSTASVYCISASSKPLQITAMSGDISRTINVTLTGY